MNLRHRILVTWSFLLLAFSAPAADRRPGTPNPDWNPPASHSATAIHPRPGGGYWLLNSYAYGITNGNLLAVGPNGSTDPSWFADVQPAGAVYGLSVASGGAVILCGSFVAVDGVARPGLARLEPSGRLDPQFVPALLLNTNVPPPGGGPPLPPSSLPPFGIHGVAAQPDDGLLVWGFRQVTRLDGRPMPFLVRLKSDGAWDDTFQFPEQIEPLQLLVLADGRFVTIEDATISDERGEARLLRQYLKRWLADGRPDPAFVPVLIIGGGVYALCEQGDSLLLGGEFSRVNDLFRDHVARILPDGQPDPEFGSPFVRAAYGQWVYTISALPDGPVFIAGEFATGGLEGRRHLARLNPDGSLDRAFLQAPIPFLATAVRALSDGGCLVASGSSPYVMRLHGDRAEGAGVFTFTTDHLEVSEGDGSIEVTVDRFWGWQEAASVRIRVEGEDAVAGEDFAGTTQTLVFGEGETRKSVRIPVFDDGWIEDLETLRVVLESPTEGAGLGSLTHLTVSLIDDDGHSAEDRSFRLPEGSIDGHFRSLALQPDGRILVAGQFSRVGITARAGLARLEQDGRLDASFNPLASHESWSAGWIRGVQFRNGQILISGEVDPGPWPESEGTGLVSLEGHWIQQFEQLNLAGDSFGMGIIPYGTDQWIALGQFDPGAEPWGLTRIGADGRVDPTFRPPGLGRRETSAATVEPDGSVLISRTDTGLHRISPDGATVVPIPLPFPISHVAGLASLPDRRFLAWGLFGSSAPGRWHPLLRCLPDGQLDPQFHPELDLFMPDYQLATVHQLTIDPQGRLLVALHAYPPAGHSFDYLFRLLPDGALDRSFEPVVFHLEGADNHAIHSIVVTADGGILVAGEFSHMNGLPRDPIVRLKGTGPTGRRQPLVRSVARHASGTAEVRLSVAPARPFALERSSNLRQWERVATNRSAVSRTVSIDSGHPVGEDSVFYRVVQLEE